MQHHISTPRSIALLALAIAALAGCGSKSSLNTTKIEKFISQDAAQRLALDGSLVVSCPDSVTPQKGDTFTCFAKTPGVDRITVNVTQKDAKGNISWSMEALSTTPIEQNIQEGILTKKQTKVTASCPLIIPARSNFTFTCTIQDAKNQQSTISVTTKDGQGSSSWQVK